MSETKGLILRAAEKR